MSAGQGSTLLIISLVKKLIYLLVQSADNLCKQFGPRSGSKLFDTDGIFLKEIFKNGDLKNK